MTSSRPGEALTIRAIAAADRVRWEPLWRGYLDFYEKRVTQDLIDFTWTRLAGSGEIGGFLALAPTDEALGLIHYLFHPSTSTMGGSCYIQDLFVLPSSRKRGVGHRLMEAVVDAARAKSVAVVYWQTEEFNGPARRLYERIAKRSPFIRYQIDLIQSR